MLKSSISRGNLRWLAGSTRYYQSDRKTGYSKSYDRNGPSKYNSKRDRSSKYDSDGDRPTRYYDKRSTDSSRFYGKRNSPEYHDYKRNGPSKPWEERNAGTDFPQWKKVGAKHYDKGFRKNTFHGKKYRPLTVAEEELVRRNIAQKQEGDGLSGQSDYTTDHDALETLDWTDLIPAEQTGEQGEGLSAVPTQVLAEKKLLSRALVNSLVKNRKYEYLTPVQAQTLIPILNNQSVVVRAKTGTGKTGAFAIPSIQKALDAKKSGKFENKVKAVIISPTRELAQQIADEVSKTVHFGGLSHVTVQCFVGGLSKNEQLKQGGFLKGRPCDIVVATPGRLLDILDDPKVLADFDSLSFKVFDEADRLLDIGFEGILRQIRDRLDSVTPEDHEVPLLLFSATADQNVRRFAAEQYGERVTVVDTIPKDEPTANELVDQSAVVCNDWAEVYEGVAHEIVDAFVESQMNGTPLKAIVFLPTVLMVDNYERVLRHLLPSGQHQIDMTMAIHGQKTQAARQKLADRFRQQENAVLVTTDVIARGMDFPKVTHVFQVGCPPDVSSYVHRIGRTARIGNRGKSILYITNHVTGYLESLKRQGITPQVRTFKPDPAFHGKFMEKTTASLRAKSDAPELINSLLSYMSILKSKYPIHPGQFVKDMIPFVNLYGLDFLPLNPPNRSTWQPKQSSKKRGNFGSSRKSRMRW